MNIDTLLETADPAPILTMRERAEIDRLVDSVHPKHGRTVDCEVQDHEPHSLTMEEL